MKKITLLIGLALLLGFGGMAQKKQNALYGKAPKMAATKKNPNNKTAHSPSNFNVLANKEIRSVTTESFEGTFPPTGWTKQNPDGGTGWAQCADGTTPLDGWNGGTQSVPPGGGGFVAYCTWTTGGATSNDQWLISPQISVTASDSLSFYLWFFGAYIDTLEIRISTTGNSTADFTTQIDLIDTIDLTPMSSWHKLSYSLAPYAGQQIYVAFRERVADNYNNGAYFALDLFSFGSTVIYPNDISPISLVYPTPSDLLTIADPITVAVANLDSIDHDSIPITCIVDGGTPIQDTIFTTIPALSIANYTFSQTWDFSTYAHIYDVVIYTSYPSDGNLINDTLITSVYNNFDAASLSIDMLPVNIPGTINPLATFENTGSISVTFDVTMNIDVYTSTKTVTTLAPGATQQVTFDPWNAVVGAYTVEVYTQLANDMDLNNDTLTKAISVQDMKKAYGYIAYDPSAVLPEGPAIIDLNNPATIISLADQTGQNFLSGGAWANNHWYAAVYTDNNLVEIDTISGARTVIGPLGVGIYGLSYDQITSTLYGTDGTSLYTINTSTGAATLVGSMGVSGSTFINLACNSTTGIIYAVNIADDIVYRINKTTGAATAVGAIGFDASYAQGMEFHPDGACYMAAYNATAGSGELRTVNTTTGATTLVGAFPGGAEIDAMAIPGLFTQNAVDAGVVSIIAPSNDTTCVLSAAENIIVSIMSFGTDSIWNFDVSYQINSGIVVTETISDTLIPFGTLLYTFTSTEDLSAVGAYVIKAYTSVAGDLDNANDTTTKTVMSADASITVNILTDSYGSETTWELINNSTSLVIASGGPYGNSTLYSTSVCVLSSDCFTFNIYDSWGDGICCAYGNGTYEIQWDGISFGIIPGSFTTSATITNICQPQPNDVGSVSIDISNGLPGTIIPKGTVKNFGTLTQTFTATLLITPGAYTSTQTITSLAPGVSQQVTFTPNWNPTVGTYTATLYTTLPGGDANTSNDTIVKTITIIDIANKAYCYIAYDPSAALPAGPAIVDLDNPATIISLADQSTLNFVSGGTWANNHWYGAVYSDNNFIEIDTLTGARTVIGPLGNAINGLTYDQTTDTLFGTDGTSLYTINIPTGAATLIGSMGISGSTFINLACNGITGIIYSVNVADDILYSINKTTGAALSVGAIGFDASYAQGMEFHPDGTCYMAAYNVTSSSGELRTVNTLTGSTTLIGAFPGGAEIDALAIPGIAGVGIEETTVNTAVNVFPNPAKDVLNIFSSENILRIKLMNAFGQLVFNYNINSNNTVISTSSLAEGVYYLQIETAAGFTSKKISVIK
ncbi:MAG: choice-of-anchor J domain-containing protein [Bacteroidota bacterium]